MCPRRRSPRCTVGTGRPRPRLTEASRLARRSTTILDAGSTRSTPHSHTPAAGAAEACAAARVVGAVVADSARSGEPPLDTGSRASRRGDRGGRGWTTRAAARRSLVLPGAAPTRARCSGACCASSGSRPRATASGSRTRSSAPWRSIPACTTPTSGSALYHATTPTSRRPPRRSCASCCFAGRRPRGGPAAKCCGPASAACCCAARPTTSST